MKTGILFLWLAGQLAMAANDSCTSLGFGTVPNGGTITGYTWSISPAGTPCASLFQTVTCINGVLTGPDLYPSCSDINQDCAGVPNGGSVSGYSSPVAPCIPSTVTCINGALTGPMPFLSCME